jgi:hypothetical protein
MILSRNRKCMLHVCTTLLQCSTHFQICLFIRFVSPLPLLKYSAHLLQECSLLNKPQEAPYAAQLHKMLPSDRLEVNVYWFLLRAGWSGFDSRQGLGILSITESRTALRPIQPPIQWVPGALSLGGKSDRGVKLTTHLYLVPRSIMCGAVPPLPQYVFMAWCSVKKVQRQLFLYLYV